MGGVEDLWPCKKGGESEWYSYFMSIVQEYNFFSKIEIRVEEAMLVDWNWD
jgi:hypothetical protein